MQLFRTKSINQLLEDAFDKEHGMKRTLGRGSLITLGIGAIIGTGIFVLTELWRRTMQVPHWFYRFCFLH